MIAFIIIGLTLLIIIVPFTWFGPLYIQEVIKKKPKEEVSFVPSIVMTILIPLLIASLTIIAGIETYDYEKIEESVEQTDQISHPTIYNIALEKLRKSLPKDDDLEIESYRIQYDSYSGDFTVSFDFIGYNHYNCKIHQSKTVRVYNQEIH